MAYVNSIYINYDGVRLSISLVNGIQLPVDLRIWKVAVDTLSTYSVDRTKTTTIFTIKLSYVPISHTFSSLPYL